MNLIGFVDDKICEQQKMPDWLDGWNVRLAARSVLIDDQGRIALMHIGAYSNYKLPGGGVDDKESLADALKREMLEETGCTIELIGDLGTFLEKRDDWKMFQVSFCYISRAVEKGELILTPEEQAEGFALEWVADLDRALELVMNSESKRYDDQYIKIRDSAILRAAKNYLNNNPGIIS